MTSGTGSDNPSTPISRIEITSDTLTGRGGLALFSRYVRNVGILSHLEQLFGDMRKSTKGLPVSTLLHQLFCFLLDGTSRHLVHFDELCRDAGYAGAIETDTEGMASSHQIKRFFYRFDWAGVRQWV